jgi:hypothetical protein
MIFRNKLGCKPFQDRTVFAGMRGATKPIIPNMNNVFANKYGKILC